MSSVTPVVSAHWCARALMSRSGLQLLVAFWVAFAVASLGATSTSFLARVVGGLGQLALSTIWAGYPIAVFGCLADRRRRSAGVIALVIGIALGYWLSVFGFAGSGGIARTALAPIAGAALILAPFFAASHALTNAEHRGHVAPKAGLVLTTLMLFGFPFFGAYMHERFRRISASLREAPSVEAPT